MRIEDEKFVAIQAELKPNENEQVIDGNGNLVLPPYIDSHVHLDTTMAAGQPRWNETGTLFEGINIKKRYQLKMLRNGLKRQFGGKLQMEFRLCEVMWM